MGEGVLDSAGDRVERGQLEGLVGVVEGLRGLAHRAGLVDAVQAEGLIGGRRTLVLVVFMRKYNF